MAGRGLAGPGSDVPPRCTASYSPFSLLRLQAAVVLNDAALMRHAPALLKRFATARAAVAAIPELPVTRSFLLVVPAPDLPALRMDALDLLALALVWEASVGR